MGLSRRSCEVLLKLLRYHRCFYQVTYIDVDYKTNLTPQKLSFLFPTKICKQKIEDFCNVGLVFVVHIQPFETFTVPACTAASSAVKSMVSERIFLSFSIGMVLISSGWKLQIKKWYMLVWERIILILTPSNQIKAGPDGKRRTYFGCKIETGIFSQVFGRIST